MDNKQHCYFSTMGWITHNLESMLVKCIPSIYIKKKKMPEDDPKGLKHLATLIVYNLTLHHIVV